jgi:hypothetical protein
MPAMPRFENDIEAQFAGEAAASLGLAGRRLKKALDALHKHDADVTGGKSASSKRRTELVAAAGEAFWGYVVQRELLGLMDADYIAQEYGVPPEVKRAMGPNIRKK